MIDAKIFKIDMSGYVCDHSECEHNSKYHYNLIGNNYHLIQGTICVYITMDGHYNLYCPDCIEKLYKKLKPVLDKKLWALK